MIMRLLLSRFIHLFPMKKIAMLTLAALFFLFSCVKEANDVQPSFRDGVTIRVTLPEGSGLLL